MYEQFSGIMNDPRLERDAGFGQVVRPRNKAVVEALDGLPPAKMHCSVMAEEALKSAIEDYLEHQKLKKQI